ncbi:hypothetical protein [Bacillus sp. B-jedd]|uniref:hypothetical protein n=1 Tax=Bacillus sp. B-jedd TaxID=1476857 RepID=UPI00051568A9|nr:hypothetical protein [Bacillus sp. B-jedd]CEG25769.1 hypothetical protein BN1002_00586 [Bacillus sp. B-jedd]
MNRLGLNKKQSIIVAGIVMFIVPILGFISSIYTGTTVYIPIIAVVTALIGRLLAKSFIK